MLDSPGFRQGFHFRYALQVTAQLKPSSEASGKSTTRQRKIHASSISPLTDISRITIHHTAQVTETFSYCVLDCYLSDDSQQNVSCDAPVLCFSSDDHFAKVLELHVSGPDEFAILAENVQVCCSFRDPPASFTPERPPLLDKPTVQMSGPS